MSDKLSEERIEELYRMGAADARVTGGSLFARITQHKLSPKEQEIYDYAFRNAFASLNEY